MARQKNLEWNLPKSTTEMTWEHVELAILMDIRDELQHLNATFDCTNAQQIPSILRGISRKLPTPPKRRKRKVK